MRLTCVLLVMCGRDRLTWDRVDPEWAEHANLEQHLLGGLSRHDATEFLGKVRHQPRTAPGGHPARLSRPGGPRPRGVLPLRPGPGRRYGRGRAGPGRQARADTFDIAPGDYGQLAQRFLKSLHDKHPERWIIHLAQTPRFDEAAARAAFSPTRDVQQDEAWGSLPGYSFVQEAAEPGWLRIHSAMSDVLRRQLSGNAKEFARSHEDWRAYWQSRASVTPTNSRPSRGITVMFLTPSKPSPPGTIKPRRFVANAT